MRRKFTRPPAALEDRLEDAVVAGRVGAVDPLAVQAADARAEPHADHPEGGEVGSRCAAVGEDRGEQRAHLPGVDPLLAGLLEVDAEPEVVLDLDEQVGQPDRAAAGVQPAVQLGEAVRLRRVGLLGRVRLQPPPVVVERSRKRARREPPKPRRPTSGTQIGCASSR